MRARFSSLHHPPVHSPRPSRPLAATIATSSTFQRRTRKTPKAPVGPDSLTEYGRKKINAVRLAKNKCKNCDFCGAAHRNLTSHEVTVKNSKTRETDWRWCMDCKRYFCHFNGFKDYHCELLARNLNAKPPPHVLVGGSGGQDQSAQTATQQQPGASYPMQFHTFAGSPIQDISALASDTGAQRTHAHDSADPDMNFAGTSNNTINPGLVYEKPAILGANGGFVDTHPFNVQENLVGQSNANGSNHTLDAVGDEEWQREIDEAVQLSVQIWRSSNLSSEEALRRARSMLGYRDEPMGDYADSNVHGGDGGEETAHLSNANVDTRPSMPFGDYFSLGFGGNVATPGLTEAGTPPEPEEALTPRGDPGFFNLSNQTNTVAANAVGCDCNSFPHHELCQVSLSKLLEPIDLWNQRN